MGRWREGRHQFPYTEPAIPIPHIYHPSAKPYSRPRASLRGIPQAASAWNLSSRFAQTSESYLLHILEALKMEGTSTTLGWI